MALDRSRIGFQYPPRTFQVTREKIREFVDSVDAAQAVYRDPQSARSEGYPDVIAPPTFATVLIIHYTSQLDDAALGIDSAHTVNASQRFQYSRPIVAGDVLTSVMSIDEIASWAGRERLTYRVEISDESGAHVVTAWSTAVVLVE